MAQRLAQNLPDFVCIGAQKAATSWLYQVLGEHPQVWIPPVGEPHYFDRPPGAPLRLRMYSLAERAKQATRDPDFAGYLEGLAGHQRVSSEWYADLFAWPVAPGVVKGDITPAYLDIPESRVVEARELLGDVPLVVIVRRPLERELSQLRMWATRRAGGLQRPRTPAEWMVRYELMVERADRSGYSRGIPRWRQHFSRVGIFPFADVRDRPAALIEAIESHLGIGHHGDFEVLHTPVHSSRKLRIPDAVVARAAERVAPEDEYLRAEFGDEFYDRTK